MIHYTHLSEPQLDVLIYFPRYFTSSFLNNEYSLFSNKYSFQSEKNRFNFFLEKIIPQWVSFGVGVFKIRKSFFEKISEEGLKQNHEIKIKNEISKKIVELLSNFSLRNSKFYCYFWTIYNHRLKNTLIQNKLLLNEFFHLLRFFSTKSNTTPISIEQYVSNMKNDQNEIYYYFVKKNMFSRNDPNLEVLIKNGTEVILIFESTDEVIINLLDEKVSFWNKKTVLFKKVGYWDCCETLAIQKNTNLSEKFEPATCLSWFSSKLATKFLKIENSIKIHTPSSILLFGKNTQKTEHGDLSKMSGKLERENFLLLKKQSIIFEINGSNNLIRVFNKYLRNKVTKTISKEIGILIWENSNLRCGIFLIDEWTFSKRIDNILTLFLLILYFMEHNSRENYKSLE